MSCNLEIKGRLESALEKLEISQSRASKDIGYSSSVISDYLSGKYNGKIEKLEEAILKWLSRLAQQSAQKKVEIVETDALKKITNAISMAHAERDIALIVGDAGSGKTTACKTYKEQNPRTCVYIQVVHGMNRRSMLYALAGALSIETYRVSEQSLIRLIAEALHDRDMLVIFDEADYLKADALEFSRRLVHDLGESGLVLVGLPRLTATIQNLKNDHRQLESRIGVYLPISSLSKKDARLIVSSVWESVDADTLNALYMAARGDVRIFTKIISRMQKTMSLNKLDLPTIEVVELAAQMVITKIR